MLSLFSKGPPDTDAHLKPYLARFKNWGHNWRDGLDRMNFNWPCYGKRVRTICVFGVGDLPMLTSRKELFANKFYINFEPLTLQCLEDWLYNMTVDEYAGRVSMDVSFYKNLDIVKNKVDGSPSLTGWPQFECAFPSKEIPYNLKVFTFITATWEFCEVTLLSSYYLTLLSNHDCVLLWPTFPCGPERHSLWFYSWLARDHSQFLCNHK